MAEGQGRLHDLRLEISDLGPSQPLLFCPTGMSSKNLRVREPPLASHMGTSARSLGQRAGPWSIKSFSEDTMRALRFLNLGILAALLASSAVVYAQDDKQQEEKPKQEEPKRQQEPTKQDQARPETKQDEAKPAARQDEMKAPRQDEAKPARPAQEQQRPEQQPRGDMKPAQQEPNRQEQSRPEAGRQEAGRQEAGQQQAGRPEDHDRAGGNRGRIPDDRFRAEFGREHHFAIPRPQVVSGRPEFQYGGYTFILVDPWPPAWAYSDDCYIDYIDGYYFLFDLRHPEARLALEVVM